MIINDGVNRCHKWKVPLSHFTRWWQHHKIIHPVIVNKVKCFIVPSNIENVWTFFNNTIVSPHRWYHLMSSPQNQVFINTITLLDVFVGVHHIKTYKIKLMKNKLNFALFKSLNLIINKIDVSKRMLISIFISPFIG